MTRCPICKETMAHKAYGDVEIDICPNHGIWLDKTELFQITEQERRVEDIPAWEDWLRSAVSTPTDHSRTVSCPKCDSSMAVDKYEGVTIYVCRDHGTWLDSGELDAILNNLRLDPFYLRGVGLRLSSLRY